MSTAETTANKFYLENTIRDCKDYLKTSGKLQKEKIIQWAESLESLGVGKTTICAKISEEARNEFDWSEGQLRYIREVLSPLGFTDNRFTNISEGGVTPALENLNPVSLEQLKTFDNEQLRTFIQDRKADLDHALFEAHNRGLAVVDHDEREPKISNYKPDAMDTDFSLSLIDLASNVYSFGDIVAKLARKVREYPIHDVNIDKQRALETNRLSMLFHGLIQKYLPSLTDDKYAFSEQMWYDVLVKHEQFSKHGAAVKSKVQAVDEHGNYIDEWRNLTREVVTDNLEETVEDLKKVQTSNVLMAAIQGWVDWHDVDGKVINYTASRRIRVHPKLSETAFGAD